MAGTSLRLQVMSDREVLLIVRDVADGDGWAYAYDVGERIGLDETHRKRAAAQRLSWLRRYGAVERELLPGPTAVDDAGTHGLAYDAEEKPRFGQRWRLTELGEAIALGRLRKPTERAIDGMSEAEALLAIRTIGGRARHSAAAKLLEREWRYQWTRENGGG